MEHQSFIFTIFFLTFGPLRIIGPYAQLTKQVTPEFKKKVAIKASLIALGICLYIAFFGERIVSKYRISVDALTIAAGMVLLISSLLTIFSSKESKSSIYSDLPLNPTTTKLAISPVASPIVVPPIGIAVIWISIMVSPNQPGMQSIVIETILIMMSLDFLVMFFIDQITKISILMLFFLILGDALVFLQVALADEMIISAFRHLRIIPR